MEDMTLVDREKIRSPINLPRAGINDPDGGVVFPARFKNKQLGPAIDVEIHKGILHGVEMARLSGEVEQVVLTLDQVSHAELIPNIGDVDSNPVFITFKIKEVAPILRNKAVYDRHSSPDIGQRPGQVASDETQPPGDEDALVGEIGEISHA